MHTNSTVIANLWREFMHRSREGRDPQFGHSTYCTGGGSRNFEKGGSSGDGSSMRVKVKRGGGPGKR